MNSATHTHTKNRLPFAICLNIILIVTNYIGPTNYVLRTIQIERVPKINLPLITHFENPLSKLTSTLFRGRVYTARQKRFKPKVLSSAGYVPNPRVKKNI